MEYNSTEDSISYMLASAADDIARALRLIYKTSPEFISIQEYNNTYIGEFSAIKSLGCEGKDYSEFIETIKRYKIQTFTINPGNFRLYLKSQIHDAWTHKLHTGSWESQLKRIQEENSTVSDIALNLGLLLEGTGISVSGEDPKIY